MSISGYLYKTQGERELKICDYLYVFELSIGKPSYRYCTVGTYT